MDKKVLATLNKTQIGSIIMDQASLVGYNLEDISKSKEDLEKYVKTQIEKGT